MNFDLSNSGKRHNHFLALNKEEITQNKALHSSLYMRASVFVCVLACVHVSVYIHILIGLRGHLSLVATFLGVY